MSDIVAWRLKIGDSDQWAYADREADVDFYGRKSGRAYVKEPLYAADEIERLRDCVTAALNMVDGDGTPPDWDELRAAIRAAGGIDE